MDNATRICPRCNVERPLDQFYLDAEARDYARTGHRRRRPCRPCNREYVRQVNAPRRELIRAYKMERGCMDCGFKPEIAEVLEFDHRPDEVKLFELARPLGQTLEAITAEMAKCDVVCANCHRVRTVKRKQADAGAAVSRYTSKRRKRDEAAGIFMDLINADTGQLSFDFTAA